MTLAMQQERRLYPRYSVDFELTVDIEGHADQPVFSARADNLSQNGVNIQCDDEDKIFVIEGMSYSDECVLHFALKEGDEAMACRARLSVKRRMSSSRYSLGFHFLNMTSEQEQKLDAYLYSLRLSR